MAHVVSSFRTEAITSGAGIGGGESPGVSARDCASAAQDWLRDLSPE